MTNTQRNTTAIGVLLALILTSGFYVTQKSSKQINLLQTKNKEFAAQIVKFDKLLFMRDKIENDYTQLKLMLAQQSKVIAQKDNPAITFNYLLQLLQWMGRNINFDFSLSSNKVAETTWNEYILSGSSTYRDAANFIKQIEYQRALLTIEEVTMATNPAEVSDSVVFSIVFKTHYNTEGTSLDIIQKKDIPAYSPSFVSFRPRIYDIAPYSDIDPSLIKIDKASIIGITESRVFIRDDIGIIHILSVGDHVAYGYLYSINLQQEKVIFKINQYGSTEDKSLYLEKTGNAKK